MNIPHSSLDQSDLEWVAQRCGKAKRLDVNKWVCLCPAHADHTPSLSVSMGRKGQILLYCHAGCSYDSVLDNIGSDVQNLLKIKQYGNTCTPPVYTIYKKNTSKNANKKSTSKNANSKDKNKKSKKNSQNSKK